MTTQKNFPKSKSGARQYRFRLCFCITFKDFRKFFMFQPADKEGRRGHSLLFRFPWMGPSEIY